MNSVHGRTVYTGDKVLKDAYVVFRGRSIVSHTPMGRLGQAEDLIGAVTWLLSDAAAFVTGVVIPVDGGVSAFSGI